MTIRNGCFINNGSMAIINLFNNKIDNLIFFGRWNWRIQSWNVCAHCSVKFCLLCRWRWHKVEVLSCKRLWLMMRVNKATTSGNRGFWVIFNLKNLKKRMSILQDTSYNCLLTKNRQKNKSQFKTQVQECFRKVGPNLSLWVIYSWGGNGCARHLLQACGHP
jgi:hypothetical protein